MMGLLKEYWYAAAAGAVLLFAAALLANRIVKNKKREKEQFEKRMKDQVLNEALKNNLGRRNAFKEPDHAVPLEGTPGGAGSARAGQAVMKLTVAGSRAASYVVNPEEHVLLGSAEGMNDIILKDERIAQQHCDFFSYKGHVYVRNLNPAYPMALRRGGNQAMVGEQGVRVLTGDQVLMGSHRVEITLMDYVGTVIEG